jgi:hypothetical protein
LNIAPAPRGLRANRFEIALGNPQKIRELEEALRHSRAELKTAERELAHEKAKSSDWAAQFHELDQAFGSIKAEVAKLEKDAGKYAADVGHFKGLLQKTEEKFVREQEAKNALAREVAKRKVEVGELQARLTEQLTYREASIAELKRIHGIATRLEKEKAELIAYVEELEGERDAPPPRTPSPVREESDDDGEEDKEEPPIMPADDAGPGMMAEDSSSAHEDHEPAPAPVPAPAPAPAHEGNNECKWWAQYKDRPKAKPCYGQIATLGHHYHGVLKLCERHICTERGPGCRIIARPVGYKCGACSRTEEGKERRRQYDNDRAPRRRW